MKKTEFIITLSEKWTFVCVQASQWVIFTAYCTQKLISISCTYCALFSHSCMLFYCSNMLITLSSPSNIFTYDIHDIAKSLYCSNVLTCPMNIFILWYTVHDSKIFINTRLLLIDLITLFNITHIHAFFSLINFIALMCYILWYTLCTHESHINLYPYITYYHFNQVILILYL